VVQEIAHGLDAEAFGEHDVGVGRLLPRARTPRRETLVDREDGGVEAQGHEGYLTLGSTMPP
jgi:hypothetical protein